MGKADPYAKLTIASQSFSTKVHSNGGKKPIWGDSYEFKVQNEKEVKIEVLDKETVGKDKPIGSCTVSIMDWIQKGSFEGEVEINDSAGKPAGKVTISVKFQRPSAAPPGPPGTPKAPGPPGTTTPSPI